MVINIRHFIITVIAIFLSLGIGIFIGAIMDSQKIFISQQKALVSQIEEEFDTFRQKNYDLLNKIQELEEEKKNYEQLIENIQEYLSSIRLEGLNILLIKNYDENNLSELADELKKTGAQVTEQIINGNNINGINESYFYKEQIYKNISDDSIDIVILLLDSINGYEKDEVEIYRDFIDQLQNLNNSIIVVENTLNNNNIITGHYEEMGIKVIKSANSKMGKIKTLLHLLRENKTKEISPNERKELVY